MDDRGHLFEPQASCVPCSPPLAFFRELRGTAPGIHQHPGQETVLRVPGATMTQHPIKQKKPPHLHDLPKRKSCSVRRFFAWLRVNTEKQERLPFLIMNYLLVRLTAPKKLRTSYLYCPCIRIAHESKLSTQFYHQVSAIQRLFTFSSQEHPQMPR